MKDIEAPRGALAIVRKTLWFAVALAGLALVVGYLWVASQSVRPGADYARAFGGPFTMTDQYGRTVTDRSLRGKPYAIFFGFTRCPDICPTTLNRMAQLRKALGADGMKFEIVFVSVDPGRDRREDIGNYLTLFGTPVIGLTGTEAQLAQIVDAYHIFYRKVPLEGGDYTIDHTASIFLMDAQGAFVGTIDHQENQQAAIGKVRRLIAGA